MALNARQKRRYVSLATIYRRTEVFGVEIYRAIAEHVRCAIATTSNYDQPKAMVGLVKEDSVQTSDYIHFEAAQDVVGGDVVFLEAESQQRANEWYQTTGTPEIHEFRANVRKLFLNNTEPLKPEQILP